MGDEIGAAATEVPDALDATAPSRGGRRVVKLPRIHQYELLRELGSGGMGTVYLARDTRLARKVALKLLQAPSPAALERFLLEARATARCTHEHIVIIHDVNETDGQPYMVLEYLEGAPLATGKPVAEGRAVELMLPVVRALVRAHGEGIVHRDLKPDNIFVTHAGVVKVLDFGIAKLLDTDDGDPSPAGDDIGSRVNQTMDGALVGTMPYMSPEQWRGETVDHRTDLWAVGIILFELVAGRHPVTPLTREGLMAAATDLDSPMPPLGEAAPACSAELAALVDRCLAKRAGDRFADASALLEALEPLEPRRSARRGDDNPFPGLVSFRAEDADRFFGRDDEIGRVVARLEKHPLVGVVGPSGAGKSSLIRAGVIPALTGTAEVWEPVIMRPGKAPMQALAAALATLDREVDATVLTTRLSTEPGYAGAAMRQRAARTRGRLLLFIDQFEELFTLAPEADRDGFLACLAGIADDPGSPLRAVVSLRSDFLDRLAGRDWLMDALTPGLVFLPPPTAHGLRAALVEPVAMMGYRYESPALVDRMIDELASTPGALPLLQFAAGRLWEQRDRDRRLITAAAHDAIGGVAGALATHADAVIAELPPTAQRRARAIFERLVTPERTRDVVELSELTSASGDRRVIDTLVDARLLLMHTSGDEPTVELVHESMVESWPTLRRWLDAHSEHAAFLARVRSAARQWDDAGRPQGLLWSGEAAGDARRWRGLYDGELPDRERRYLDAVVSLASRSRRRRRMLVGGALIALSAVAVAAVIALIWIRDAEQTARTEAQRAAEQAERAHAETERAQAETDRAQRAEAETADKVRELESKELALQRALDEARSANQTVAEQSQSLREKASELQRSLADEERAKELAQQRALEAEEARTLAAEEQARKEKLRAEKEAREARMNAERGRISRELKK